MKKIIFGISVPLIIVLTIICLVNINPKKDFIIYSKMTNKSYNLGKFYVNKAESKEENDIIYKTNDIKRFKAEIIKSDCYYKTITNDKYLLYIDNLYYVLKIDYDNIIINELMNMYRDHYFPFFTDIRLITGTSVKGDYFKNYYTFSDLEKKYNEYFTIDSKTSFLSYINSLNKDYAYYDLEKNIVYIKRDIDEADQFNIYIELFDEGIYIYGKRSY